MTIDPADVLICIQDEPPLADAPVPMTTPIVQTSLFAFPDFQSLLDGLAAEHEYNVYSRGRNPTAQLLEDKLARLERGEQCSCFASGMAAVSAVMLGLLRAGDHILFVNHTYGPTIMLADHLRNFGIEHDLVLDVSADAVRAALRPNTRLVWIESPGTMLFRLLDIEAIAAIARAHGAISCVDNSWATPLLQKPLELGADIVVHSATKYIGGHSDVVGGAVVSSSELMHRIFTRAFMLNGGILAPFDAWLLLRGLRTLPARLRQHEADALRVAAFLRTHDRVSAVLHAAYDPTPHTMAGFTGMFSFVIAGPDASSAFAGTAAYLAVHRFIDALEVFRIGVSWGGVESLVIAPNRGSNVAQLDAQRIPHSLVRLSIGLEGADTLIADVAAALEA